LLVSGERFREDTIVLDKLRFEELAVIVDCIFGQ
jgi:hypothetical protein